MYTKQNTVTSSKKQMMLELPLIDKNLRGVFVVVVVVQVRERVGLCVCVCNTPLPEVKTVGFPFNLKR